MSQPTDEQIAAFKAAQPSLDSIVPASDELLDQVRDAGRRYLAGRDTQSVVWALNLTGFMGERMASVLARLDELRAERDALHWSLTQLGYGLGVWCEDPEHDENCLCVDPEEGDWSQRCADLNEWRPALLRVDANHGDQLAAYLPDADALRLYGDLIDRARQVLGDEREETA